MNNKATLTLLLSVIIAGCAPTRNPAVLSTEDFADALEYIGIAVKKENTSVWGTSPIIDGNTGNVHLFVAEWDARGMPFSDVKLAFEPLSHYAHNPAIDTQERPQILKTDNQLAYIYFASRADFSGGENSCSSVYRIAIH